MADNFNVITAAGVQVTIASSDIGDGVQAAQHVIVDGSGNIAPVGDVVARAGFVVASDGTNQVTVKPASTLAATTDTGLVVRPLAASDGTHSTPIGDAQARALSVIPGDGTHLITVKAASTLAQTTDTGLVVRPLGWTDGTNTAPTMDAVGRAGFVKVTDGTNTQPTGDAAARAIFTQLTDGTNGPVAVKAASTAAVATDPGLVVTVSPNSWASAEYLAFGSLPSTTSGKAVALQADAAGTLKVGVNPLGTPVYGTANGGATANNVTLTIPSAKMGYLDFVDVDGLGATTGGAIAVTIAGVLGGTLTYQLGIPAGVLVPLAPLRLRFNPPLQASAVNTNFVISVPSFGTGNTAASTNAGAHYI